MNKQRDIESKRQNDNFERIARLQFKNKVGKVSESYLAYRLKLMEEHVFPVIGDCGLSEVTTEQIITALKSVERNHGTELAHQICSLCAHAFTEGIVVGLCDWNPTVPARAGLARRHRVRVPLPVTADEVAAVAIKSEGYTAHPLIGAALRLSVHFLVYRCELCIARWNDIDWDNSIWRYELPSPGDARRLKLHYVPLSTQALGILQDLRRATDGTQFVFPSRRSPERPIEPIVLRRALRSLGLESRLRSSDALRNGAKVLLLDSLSIPPEIVNQQLGHALEDRKECGVDCVSCLKERRRMMQSWSDYLSNLVRGKQASEKL